MRGPEKETRTLTRAEAAEGRIEAAEQELRRLREALKEIRDQDPVENALDAQWSARIAELALSPQPGRSHVAKREDKARCPDCDGTGTAPWRGISGRARLVVVECGTCRGTGEKPR